SPIVGSTSSGTLSASSTFSSAGSWSRGGTSETGSSAGGAGSNTGGADPSEGGADSNTGGVATGGERPGSPNEIARRSASLQSAGGPAGEAVACSSTNPSISLSARRSVLRGDLARPVPARLVSGAGGNGGVA